MKEGRTMEKKWNALEVVQSFLPKGIEVIQLGEKDNGPALVEYDMNGDGQKEIMAIYEKEGKNYLLGLGMRRGKWQILWNRQLKYRHVYYFQLTSLERQDKHEIVIGGAIPGRQKNQLMVLEFKNNEVMTFFREYIGFDKMAIEDVDSKDGREEIILWQYTLLDQYLEVYRYEKGEMFVVPELKEYLAYQPQQQEKETSKPDTLEKGKESTWKLLEGVSGYIENFDTEEDILLMSRQTKEGEWEGLQLVVTSGSKAKQHLLTLTTEPIKNYQLIPGSFLDIPKEQIFIKINTDTEQVQSFLIGMKEGILHHYLEQLCYWEGASKQDRTVYQEGEAYAVDLEGKQIFELCIKHQILDSYRNKQPSAYIRWIKGKAGTLVPYKILYVEEKDTIS